ncbi:MAG: right-handed parallel beta-helix repeat-containing protein [Paludibacter sp.]|nr:right-handed parallel beta-helix repeat-containing protein [Paludibacter sp.]
MKALKNLIIALLIIGSGMLSSCGAIKKSICGTGTIYDTVEVVTHRTIVDSVTVTDYKTVTDTIHLVDTTKVTVMDTTKVTVIDTTKVTITDTTRVTIIDTTCVGVPPVDTIPTEPPVDSTDGTEGATIYHYENYNTLKSVSADTLSKYWHIQETSAYFQDDQSIYDMGGEHGKVFRSIFRQGALSCQSGFDFILFLSHSLGDEIWVGEDLWCDHNWTGYGAGGGYSGKILNGVSGGGHVQQGIIDTSANGNGFRAHGNWGSGNPNAFRGYYYGAMGGFFQFVAPGLVAPRNYFINVVKYLKLNTPGRKDGVYAIFINDTLNTYIDTVMWRSAAQYNNDQRNNIDALISKYEFGGPCNSTIYQSTRNNEIRLDNRMAWNYSKKSKYNWPANPKIGMRIVKPAYPDNPIYQTDSILRNQMFSHVSDTVWSHLSGSYFQPDGDKGDARTKNRVYTTTIRPTSGTVKLVFLRYDNGYNETGSRESYMKIYKVSNGVRTLYKYFQESGEGDGEPVVGTIYNTEAREVQIDYYPGSDFNGGWKIRYYSEQQVVDNFPGKVMYIDPYGSPTGNGLTKATSVPLSRAQALFDNTFDFIVLSDTVHYGAFNIEGVTHPMTVTTWHKYGNGYAKWKGLTDISGGWTQSDDFWTKKGLQGLPKSPNRIYQPIYFYTHTFMGSLFINDIWYAVSQYPDTKSYFSIESGNGTNTLRDNQGIPIDGYWDGAMLISENPTWIKGKFPVLKYGVDGTFQVSSLGDQQLTPAGMKCYLANHHNASNNKGEWTQLPNGLEVYFPGNFNNQRVFASLQDSVLGITKSTKITVKGIEFFGANKEQIKIDRSSYTTIDRCIFHRSPVASVLNVESTETVCINNKLDFPNDNGFVGIRNNGETYSYNKIKGAGVEGAFGGGHDGLHLNGIVVTGYKGPVRVEYNDIDSTGYCGINILNGTTQKSEVYNYRNFENNTMMIVSDGAANYVYWNPFNNKKIIRSNFIFNVYNNTAFHRDGNVESRPIYADSGWPNPPASITGNAVNRGWQIDSNIVDGYPEGLYQNIQTRKIVWENNVLVNSVRYVTNKDWSFSMNPDNAAGWYADSSISRNNYFVAGPGSDGARVYRSDFSGSLPGYHNVMDYNHYFNPFNPTGKVWLTNSGSPNWQWVERDLAWVRANSTFDDHSTYNKNNWTFPQTTGVPLDKFTWTFANWSNKPFSYNLKATEFIDLDGNPVSGILTLAPFKFIVLFYVRGGLEGLPNPIHKWDPLTQLP